MRLRGPGAVAVAVALAAGVAAVLVATNLHLLEPQRRPRDAVVLGITIERSATTTTTTTAPPPTTPPDDSTTSTTSGEVSMRRSYAVGSAGSVTLALRSGTLAVESVAPGAGWSYEIKDQRTDEVEISFHAGDDDEASFHASVQGGDLLVEIEPEEGESPDD